jgi:acetyl-CoA carboxylase biotin carboxylase subunit
MGDKIEAKRTAAKLGLPLVPGSDGPVEEIAKRSGSRPRPAIR